MLAVVRVLSQILVVVGKDPAELDQPTYQKRKQCRYRVKDIMANG
jgi:hypothetical protein